MKLMANNSDDPPQKQRATNCYLSLSLSLEQQMVVKHLGWCQEGVVWLCPGSTYLLPTEVEDLLLPDEDLLSDTERKKSSRRGSSFSRERGSSLSR